MNDLDPHVHAGMIAELCLPVHGRSRCRGERRISKHVANRIQKMRLASDMSEIGFIELLCKDLTDLGKIVDVFISVRASQGECPLLVEPTVPRRILIEAQ